MSVKAKRKVKGPGRVQYAVTAAQLLNAEHPVHKAFIEWVRERQAQPTKRQARRFLQAYPHYLFEKAS